jgi:hypothetical protein
MRPRHGGDVGIIFVLCLIADDIVMDPFGLLHRFTERDEPRALEERCGAGHFRLIILRSGGGGGGGGGGLGGAATLSGQGGGSWCTAFRRGGGSSL